MSQPTEFAKKALASTSTLSTLSSILGNTTHTAAPITTSAETPITSHSEYDQNEIDDLFDLGPSVGAKPAAANWSITNKQEDSDDEFEEVNVKEAVKLTTSSQEQQAQKDKQVEKKETKEQKDKKEVELQTEKTVEQEQKEKKADSNLTILYAVHKSHLTELLNPKNELVLLELHSIIEFIEDKIKDPFIIDNAAMTVKFTAEKLLLEKIEKAVTTARQAGLTADHFDDTTDLMIKFEQQKNLEIFQLWHRGYLNFVEKSSAAHSRRVRDKDKTSKNGAPGSAASSPVLQAAAAPVPAKKAEDKSKLSIAEQIKKQRLELDNLLKEIENDERKLEQEYLSFLSRKTNGEENLEKRMASLQHDMNVQEKELEEIKAKASSGFLRNGSKIVEQAEQALEETRTKLALALAQQDRMEDTAKEKQFQAKKQKMAEAKAKLLELSEKHKSSFTYIAFKTAPQGTPAIETKKRDELHRNSLSTGSGTSEGRRESLSETAGLNPINMSPDSPDMSLSSRTLSLSSASTGTESDASTARSPGSTPPSSRVVSPSSSPLTGRAANHATSPPSSTASSPALRPTKPVFTAPPVSPPVGPATAPFFAAQFARSTPGLQAAPVTPSSLESGAGLKRRQN